MNTLVLAKWHNMNEQTCKMILWMGRRLWATSRWRWTWWRGRRKRPPTEARWTGKSISWRQFSISIQPLWPQPKFQYIIKWYIKCLGVPSGWTLANETFLLTFVGSWCNRIKKYFKCPRIFIICLDCGIVSVYPSSSFRCCHVQSLLFASTTAQSLSRYLSAN